MGSYRVVIFFFFLLAITGCASLSQPQTLYKQGDSACFDALRDFHQSVGNDAQYHTDPRFPHLAFDRFSTGLFPAIITPLQRNQWLEYTAGLARTQLVLNYNNTEKANSDELEGLLLCHQQLFDSTTDNEALWASLEAAPPVIPADYQYWKKVVGFYPIAKHFAYPVIKGEQQHIIDGFSEPVKHGVYYHLPAREEQENKIHSPAGHPIGNDFIPQLNNEDLGALIDRYAPVFRVETENADDLPGNVFINRQGKPDIDVKKPSIYLFSSFTRFRGETLVQLNYSLWFNSRPATSTFDPYAGKFDAVLVRITLDRHGKPLIMDTIHHCGCYHMVFAMQPELRFSTATAGQEQPIRKYISVANNTGHLEITLSSGEHMVKGVRYIDNIPPSVMLEPLPYDQLRSLPDANNGYRGLFDSNGLLPESVRGERWFLWPFGVDSPGAMRQVGHHAITFIGERHFDDTGLFDTLFANPSP